MDDKIASWRLLQLVSAFNRKKEPLELDDIAKLGLIANSQADLHEACAALERGCQVDTAVSIFT